eukprot:CAMPEP_0117753788 /NCGR_PEP_ID=MMETSP0947-20121206/12442_1 /TAXON_ID=44440 /ORGANISM="Chattonella subsalsa, Strain CCMP2191" /LENGTH=195 /DNA_ID=CAMNT_0005572753 /DNA_START=211 /DNA_END=798 /DNA_ORIENTATION=+
MPDGIVKRIQVQDSDTMNDIKAKIGVSKKKKFALDEERTELCSAAQTVEELELCHGDWLFLKPQEIEAPEDDLKARLESRRADVNRAGKSIPSAKTQADLNKQIKLAGKKLLVVDFYADWCGPCKQIAPEFEKMFQEMANVNFVKVNVDTNKESASKYNVKSMPTFVFIKNGAEIHREQGANAAGLRSAIQSKSR